MPEAAFYRGKHFFRPITSHPPAQPTHFCFVCGILFPLLIITIAVNVTHKHLQRAKHWVCFNTAVLKPEHTRNHMMDLSVPRWLGPTPNASDSAALWPEKVHF